MLRFFESAKKNIKEAISISNECAKERAQDFGQCYNDYNQPLSKDCLEEKNAYYQCTTRVRLGKK